MDNIPSPPQPYIPHPYARDNVFTGQKDRLAEISDWYQNGRMLLIDAPGGMGKTALVWHWLENNPAKELTSKNVIWWSFYEGGATFDAFLVHAISYLTGISTEKLYLLQKAELRKKLLKSLAGRPLLFVLDGIERLLIAYHRLDAPRLPDNTVDDKVAGNMKRMCSFTSPEDSELISEILRKTKSIIILTSRIIPSDFMDDITIQNNMKHISLEGLHDNDAIELLEYLGCFAEKKEMKEIVNSFDNNALMIKLLGSGVSSDEEYKGDLSKWKKYSGEFGGSIIEYAYDQLPGRLQDLLCRISAFRFSVPYEAIENISSYIPYIPAPPDKKPDLEEKEDCLNELKVDPGSDYLKERIEEINKIEAAWKIYEKLIEYCGQLPEVIEAVKKLKEDLAFLGQCGFLLQNAKANRYDLHPVVRAFAFDKFIKTPTKDTFDKIRSYFETLPGKKSIDFQSINDLSRTIEIYYALVNAERFAEAYKLYRTRLEDCLDKASAFATIVMLLKPLFPDGPDKLPRIEGYHKQSYLVTLISNAMHMIDMSDNALVLKMMSINMDIEHKALSNLAVSLINYGIHLEYEDKITPALEAYRLARTINRIIGKESRQAYDYLRLDSLLTDIGDIEGAGEAAKMYYRFEHAQDSDSAVSMAYNKAMRLLMEGAHKGKKLDQALIELETITENVGDEFNKYNVLILKGEIALDNKDWAQAQTFFSKASVIAGKTGYEEQKSNTGLAMAAVMLGEKSRAIKLINIIESNTKQYNNIWPELAWACLAVGDREKAEKHAKRAYKESWAEGGEYTWKSSMLKTKAIFKKLNLPEPVLQKKNWDINKEIPFKDKVLDLIKEAEEIKEYNNSFKRSDPEFEDYLCPHIPLPNIKIPEKIYEILNGFFPLSVDEISLECIGEPVLKTNGIELYVRIVERKDYMINDYSTGNVLFLPLDFLYDTRLDIYYKSLAAYITRQLQKKENGKLLSPEKLFPEIQNHPLNDHRINSRQEMEQFLDGDEKTLPLFSLSSDKTKDLKRNSELEQNIIEEPDNNQAYSNLSAWYKKQDYPLGDLIDAQLKEPQAYPIMGPEAQKIFINRKREIIGSLSDYPHLIHLGWQKGLIDRILLHPFPSWHNHIERESLLNLFEYVLKHPAAFSVKSISLGPIERLGGFFEVLTRYRPCTVKKLILGDHFESYTESYVDHLDDYFLMDLPAAFPHLEKLMLKTGELKLPELVFPDLQVLLLFSMNLDRSFLDAFDKGYLKNLRKLKLWCGKYCFINKEEVFVPADLISRLTVNTRLQELSLHKSDWGDELVRAILDADLLSGLTTLDLSMGTITDKGAEMLLDNKERFRHFSGINLSDNYLSEDMRNQVKDLCPGVIAVSQKELKDTDQDGI